MPSVELRPVALNHVERVDVALELVLRYKVRHQGHAELGDPRGRVETIRHTKSLRRRAPFFVFERRKMFQIKGFGLRFHLDTQVGIGAVLLVVKKVLDAHRRVAFRKDERDFRNAHRPRLCRETEMDTSVAHWAKLIARKNGFHGGEQRLSKTRLFLLPIFVSLHAFLLFHRILGLFVSARCFLEGAFQSFFVRIHDVINPVSVFYF